MLLWDPFISSGGELGPCLVQVQAPDYASIKIKKLTNYVQSDLKAMISELIYEVKYQISARPG